ncbi:hypothetical protein IAQ61_008760, partial [Plenodomus lingam]|uniref:uncharacterized protein n=1 Tax=Leptosphaeria maculans TaxID=5022 RepID=UPI003326308F
SISTPGDLPNSGPIEFGQVQRRSIDGCGPRNLTWNDGPRVFEALDQVSSVRTRMRHANLGCHFLDVECATVSLDLGKELLEQAKTSGNSQPRVVCHGRWSGRSS